jgi:shikimate kinase
VREIVLHFGWETFRNLEADALASFEELRGHVIAVGGGAVLHPENVKQMQRLGKLVYLKISKEKLKKILLKSPLPLYLDEEDPEGSFEKLYLERKKIYEAIPSLQLDAEREESVEEIVETLRVK